MMFSVHRFLTHALECLKLEIFLSTGDVHEILLSVLCWVTSFVTCLVKCGPLYHLNLHYQLVELLVICAMRLRPKALDGF